MKKVNIIFDMQGGDNSPNANIEAVIKFIKESESFLTLVGKKEIIENELKKQLNKHELSKITFIDAKEEIKMEDNPTLAIKKKKNSSMVIALEALKEGKGDVLVSSGNTGALLTGATLKVGRIKGIRRPAMIAPVNILGANFILLDTGANVDPKEEYLGQFAMMGTIYKREVDKIENPKVGLLNIGTEENKGNEFTKNAYKYLKENQEQLGIDFVGNIEARDVFISNIDVLISDGFTGNIFLKSIEGLGKTIKNSFKEFFKNLGIKVLFVLPLKRNLKEYMNGLDYKKMGGGLFLGVKSPVIKAHGSSDATSFYYTLKQAEKIAKENINSKIEEKLSNN